MKSLTSKLQNIINTHFRNYDVTIATDSTYINMNELKINRKLEVTKIIIYPKTVELSIKQNFTIFERLFYGKKLEDAAVMVMVSTMFNLINSKSCLNDLINLHESKISTELEYEQHRGDLEVLLVKLYHCIIPYSDRNKYLIQPNITLNFKSRLLMIFSDVQLSGFMRAIGYRNEHSTREKVLPWQ